ncbi:MAG: PHP domain-containing protein [Alistipes sp.]|nr:PHP domain-containing protein [Alistipes sp.]
MKRLLLILVSALFAAGATAQVVETPVKGKTGIRLYDKSVRRTEIILPQIKGYNSYKADFHIHTIYSDGEVTPRERVREAWYDGLDIIAITDHLEIRTYEKFMLKALAPYNKDGKPYTYANAGAGNKKDKDAPMLSNLNAGYEEALFIINKEEIPIMAVRGTEIWRNPRTTGEYNAIFLKDINAICHKDLFECFRRVKEQGGFIIHNHPGWRRKTMDKSEDQVRAYGEKWVDAIEVVNGTTLYPQMIDRCVNENLTITASTDVHRPSSQVWARDCGIFRTHTIIFAKEKTEKAIKDALKKRRTIGYSANNLIGEEVWLEQFLNSAVDCKVVAENEKKGHRAFQLTNTCSIPFLLRRGGTVYVLKPFQSLRVNFGKDKNSGKYRKPVFTVDNMWTVGDKHPVFTLEIDK